MLAEASLCATDKTPTASFRKRCSVAREDLEQKHSFKNMRVLRSNVRTVRSESERRLAMDMPERMPHLMEVS